MNLSPESDRRPADSSFWRQLVVSRLSSQIMVGLVVAAIIEIALIAGISACLFQAGKSAEREFLLLQASAQLSEILQGGRELFAQAGDLRRVPNVHAYQEYRRRYTEVMTDVRVCTDLLAKVDISQDIVKETERSLLALDEREQEIFQRQQHGDRRSEKYEVWKVQSSDSLSKSVQVIEEINKRLSTQSIPADAFERYVAWLLAAALLFNLSLVIYGLHLLRARVSGPIIRLATDCDRILEGEAIPAGSPAAMNEITSLENTFKSMSLTLSKNEKRRKSFQELFQNVLAGSLNTVESGLSRALNVIQRSPNASLQSAPDLKKMIERCKNGLEHLQAILKSLTSSLDATDDKELVLNLEEVNVALLVERSLLSVEALAKERHIVAVEELTPFAVHGDNQLMQRVITNFLSNAIKYSPTNGKVTIQVEDQASAWQLSVRDEGPGISPLERKKLFTQFGQLESPDGKKRAGTGLGLVICKEIIEAHGGVVSCESTPGNGSKFWFRMPKSGMPVQRFTLSSSDTRAKEAPLTSNNKPRVMSAQKATTPIKRTARHRISIYFLSLMFVFLASQILAVCALAGRFQQIHKQAAIFSTQKDRFLKTQGCLVSLINGRLKIISDFEDDNMPAVKKTLGLIQSLEFPSPGDLATGNTEIDQQVEERIALIDRHKKFMVKTVESLPNSMADVSKLQMAMIYPSANKAFKQLEDDCYSLMDVGKQGIRNSYAVSSNLRNQIVSALFLDLFVNTLILALAVKYTINLVSRVNSLSGKAARFMDGKLPVPDQKGDDELSWLDERFCQQASQLQSSEEKEQALMAVVNHDLRTPINSILLTLENLAADTTLASESDLTTALNGSRAELLALFKRINNFLLIEKLQHSSTKLKAEKLAFDGLMEGVLEMMSSSNLIDSGRLQMEFEDPDDDWFIEGDARLIESMLVEIITNAFQYSLAGSQVELHCSKNKSGQLELDIINRCRAINAELAPYIFERYRSVQGATIHGIGLPLVAAIAILHKGEVQLLSNNAHGCIFRIELPLSA